MAVDELEAELAGVAHALGKGDLEHAAHHLGGALGLAPLDERVLANIDALAARGDLVALAAREHAFYGEVALHAHGLQRAGRLDDAVVILAQVTEVAPHRGFEVQLARWLAPLRARQGRLGAAASVQLARMLSRVSEGTIGLHRLLPGERALLEGYGELAVACASCEPSLELASMVAGILRRLGRVDLALEVAERIGGERPMFGHVQRGLALRTRGDGAAAAKEFAAAAAGDADNVYLLEQARSWFVAGEHGKAMAMLARLPPTDDPEAAGLARACEGSPGGDGVAVLDELRRRVLAPSLGAPTDATVNGLRQAAGELKPPAKLSMGVSGWESPSNRLLVALYATGTGDVARAEYAMDAPALTPDPLSSRRGGEPLWSLRDGVVLQGPAPDAALREQLAAVAAGEAPIDLLWSRAAELAARIGAGRAAEVARALVHPPETEAFLATLPDGLYRYQVAGACVLANLPDPWSVRRAVLESIVFGPIDWASGAAVVALGELARRAAEPARDIRGLLVEVIDDLLPHSCEPRFVPLLDAIPRVPTTPPDAMAKLQAWYERHLAQDPSAHDEAEDDEDDDDDEDGEDDDGDDDDEDDEDGARDERARSQPRAAAPPHGDAPPLWPWAIGLIVAFLVIGWILAR